MDILKRVAELANDETKFIYDISKIKSNKASDS